MGVPRLGGDMGGMPMTDEMSNQDLMSEVGSPEEIMGDELLAALMDPNLDPQQKAMLEEQIKRAAMQGLGG